MKLELLIKSWVASDVTRIRALEIASQLQLKDWCLSAGFLRNLVWDNLHQKTTATPLNDIDLVYFNPDHTCSEIDRELESILNKRMPMPWSVKNQARMHARNKDLPYLSTSDAMSYWPEIETAVGLRLDEQGKLVFIAPFGLNALFNKTITMNNKRRKPNIFFNRIQTKNWKKLWPELKVVAQ